MTPKNTSSRRSHWYCADLSHPRALRLPVFHDLQNGLFEQRAIVLVLDHPPLEGEPVRVDPSDPVHVAPMQVVPKRVPPAGKVLPPRGRPGFSLGRDRLLRVRHLGEPDVERLAVVLRPFPRHLGERRDEVVPADELGRDLQVPP